MLTLPETIDTGHCLLNSSVRSLIRVINHGGPGRFCFVREADWPMANFKDKFEVQFSVSKSSESGNSF